MHGLIFVTWEKFLNERFGSSLLNAYRSAIGETAATAPLANRIYDDTTLLLGVNVACQLTGISAHTLLREYGHYFVINGLTSHLCAYLLTPVKSGRELLLIMSQAHAQMRRVPDGLTPPLFGYEPLPGSQNNFALIYDSPRQLCSVLLGAIEGAAERYGEKITIVERTCMKQGARACRFEVYFQGRVENQPAESLESQRRHLMRHQLADLVLTILPDSEGITPLELKTILSQKHRGEIRISVLLEALQHLQYAGLVASTTNTTGDELMRRRYWRAPRQG
ncbi:MAG TPA: heme NO-binding domain-containing protein [Ktedonosporobacter sp.]|nr:heme NO-binding domain-containing protein [Ktedonosporobacter sp.]